MCPRVVGPRRFPSGAVPGWRSRSRSSSRIHSAETSTASVRVCGDRGSTIRAPKIHGWLPHEFARAHTSKVVLSLTHKQWCRLVEQQVLDRPTEKAMDRRFYLFATHTPIAHGDSFDLDAVEPCPLIAAAPSPCGSPSACERDP